ncbi:hypothetical protein AMELA_G00176380 [Ameiurus melas]|uniref:Uncharacterized protein n=1 Tax=Ameiurus melas TaxID=219545 RepID=A0A7J6ADI8_AMEME|nr:hypothetical protein AMELA_G00176380 [Ameiurus melas]
MGPTGTPIGFLFILEQKKKGDSIRIKGPVRARDCDGPLRHVVRRCYGEAALEKRRGFELESGDIAALRACRYLAYKFKTWR